MDTELKRNSFSSFRKGLAFVTVVLCFAVGTTVFGNAIMADRANYGMEPLLEPDYIKTDRLTSEQFSLASDLEGLLRLKSEENIRQGNTIDKTILDSRVDYSRGMTANGVEYNRSTAEAEVRDELIASDLRDYYFFLQRVDKINGIDYYATNGENIYTNTNRTDKSYFLNHKAYYVFDKDGFSHNPAYKNNYGYPTFFPTDSNTIHTVYIAVSDQYLESKQAEWSAQAALLQKEMAIIICSVLLLLIALVYLIWKAGRKDGREDIHMLTIDRLYTDISLLLLLGVVATWAAIMANLISSYHFDLDMLKISPVFWGAALVSGIFCSMGLVLLLSLVKHIKNRTLIRHSLLYILFDKFRDTIRAILNFGPLAVKITLGILLLEITIFALTLSIVRTHYDTAFIIFWFFFYCIITAASIYYILRKIKPFSDISNGVQEIRKGKLDYVIEVPGDGVFSRLANDINSIADGLKNAVEKEMKAERLKSELITNVSHDLKTPLTSIINYANLLSQESLTPEEANDYVAIIKQKSEKLNILTQDLFDISKAQTGNIAVEPEEIDISELLRQSLAEFEEQIASSGLEFKVNLQDTDMHVQADGKLLSRVFENLTGNILKYSLSNTRVYIDAYTKDNSVFVEYKNIANYEMNFREDEIVERFIRGDKSRTTDGSGLGLAIAQSYVKACGGTLQINVDGDLFKATVKFGKT